MHSTGLKTNDINNNNINIFLQLKCEELLKIPLLVFANKNDLPEAANQEDIIYALGLNELKDRPWFLKECCAITTKGVTDGLDFIASQMKIKNKVNNDHNNSNKTKEAPNSGNKSIDMKSDNQSNDIKSNNQSFDMNNSDNKIIDMNNSIDLVITENSVRSLEIES